MSLNVRPILSALLRNRTGAVLVDTLYIVMQRVEKIRRPTGIDVANIFVVSSAGFTDHYQAVPSIREDLTYLRGLPGVIAGTPLNAVPLSGGGSSFPLVTRPDAQRTDNFNYFEVDEQALDTLGVH